MKRLHNSTKKSLIFKNPEIVENINYWKPQGLFYSIDNEWLEWCKKEEPNWIFKYNFEVIINPEKILIIDSYEGIKRFNQLYCKRNDINWMRVYDKYCGIELKPYFYEYRCEFMWYLSWDVASGCIWNEKAIKEIIKL